MTLTSKRLVWAAVAFAVVASCAAFLVLLGHRNAFQDAADRIKSGMTEQEVREIVGRPPDGRHPPMTSMPARVYLWVEGGDGLEVLFDRTGRVQHVETGQDKGDGLIARLLRAVGL